MSPLRAHPWAYARSPRGPLCAHPVVLYVLRPWFPKRSTRLWSSVHSPRGPLHADPVGVCGPLRAHPLVFYVLLPWFPNRSTRLESSAHSGLTPVIVCALTPSVVRCTLTRGPLRAHPVCDPLRLRAVVLYVVTSYVVICVPSPWSSSRCPWSSHPWPRVSLDLGRGSA